MSFPLPPREPDKVTGGELDDDEVGFILDGCLKDKHRKDPSVIAFIDAFVRCKSIDQASAECGIHRRLGYKYRHRQDIANAIQKLTDKSAIKYGMDTSEIFERAKEIVEFDPLELQNPDGTYKSNLHDIPAPVRRCLKKLKVKNLYKNSEDINGIKTKIIVGEMIEYEFYDKMKGIELVGREKEMFKNTTKVEHTVSKNMASILLESAKRADNYKLVDKTDVVDVTDYHTKGDEDEARD